MLSATDILDIFYVQWNHYFERHALTSKGSKLICLQINDISISVIYPLCQGPISTIMNMPPPPAPNAYNRLNKALMEAAKKVAGESMEAAAIDIHHLKGGNTDIANCGVSCDGTWQRRGHSSVNGLRDNPINGHWEVPGCGSPEQGMPCLSKA